MSSRSLVFPLAVLVVLVAAGPAVGHLGAAHSSPDTATSAASSGGLDRAVTTATATATPAEPLAPSSVTWRVTLRPDGDARWEVAVSLPIRDGNDSAAFDDIAARFLGGQYGLGLEQFRTNADAASAATNRSMSIEDVVRTTDKSESSGELVLAFSWTNFGRVEGDRLVVGDAFDTPSGTWLPDRLEDGWVLVIGPPPGYDIVEAPRVVDGTAQWVGPIEFTADQPRVVFAGETPTPTPTPTATSPPPTPSPTPTATPPSPTPSPTPTATPPSPTPSPTPTATQPSTTTAGPNGSGGFPSMLLIAAIVLLAGVSAAMLAYVNRNDGDAGLGAVLGGSDGGSAPAATEAEADDAAAPADSPAGSGNPGDGTGTGGNAGGAAAGGAAAVGAGAAGSEAGNDEPAEDDDEVDPELLSDEERVERLLDRNGGRMKQASIVKETGWSNAKVSQLLSGMADDDRIDKLRIGRENLISFPDEDVTDIDSE